MRGVATALGAVSSAFLRGPIVHAIHKSGCTGKHAYMSMADAKAHMRKFVNIKHLPYRCRHCGLWHTTTRGKLGAS